MPVAWTKHTTLRAAHGLPPLDSHTRTIVEELIARALGLAEQQQRPLWGEAIGYGLYSTAVVRVPAALHGGYQGTRGDVAVKVFKNAADRTVEFQRTLSGLDLPDTFQWTVDAGRLRAADGSTRGYVVLQYVEGLPLDELVGQAGGHEPEWARAILAAFLHGLLIPAWSRGYRFWDFRAANLIIDPSRARVVMIDTDALRTTIQEMLAQPSVWTRRDEQERLAFKRLPGLLALVLGQTGAVGWARLSAAIERSGLLAALHGLGRGATNAEPAEAAVDHLLGLSAA